MTPPTNHPPVYAYIARDAGGCTVAITAADEHLHEIALTVAGWILDGLTIERCTADHPKPHLSLVCPHRTPSPQPKTNDTKYFRTLHLIAAISQDRSLEQLSTEDLAYEITDGASVGLVLTQAEDITPVRAAELLTAFGSEHGFFNLDSHDTA